MPRVNWSIVLLCCFLMYIGATSWGWVGAAIGIVVCSVIIHTNNLLRNWDKEVTKDRIHNKLINRSGISREDIVFVINNQRLFTLKELRQMINQLAKYLNITAES